jgi:hypothetical protein
MPITREPGRIELPPMVDKIVLILCIQREGDEHSERFVSVALDPGGSVHRCPPLVESDMRSELRNFGFPDAVIEDYIRNARAFKTTTTMTIDDWGGMFGFVK